MAPSSLNFQRVSAILEELARGNRAPFWEACHDDLVWRTLVQGAWRREYFGKRSITEEILRPLQCVLAERPETPTHLIDSGDVIVLRAKGASLTIDGQTYDNYNTFVIHIRDAKIARYEEYCDTDLMARALSDRNLVTPIHRSISTYVHAARAVSQTGR